MASDLEYDSAGMRAALTALRDLIGKLETEQRPIDGLDGVTAPGQAPATESFHQRYLDWVDDVRGQHADIRQRLRQAVDSLVAVDEHYNQGELARELGFRAIQRQLNGDGEQA